MKNFSYLSLKPGNALVKSHSTLNGREKTFSPAGRRMIVTTTGKISHVCTSKTVQRKGKITPTVESLVVSALKS